MLHMCLPFGCFHGSTVANVSVIEAAGAYTAADATSISTFATAAAVVTTALLSL